MTKTSIEWAEAVWNPITGCTKVSPGCANCYAERMAKRLKAMGVRGYENAVSDRGYWTGNIKLVGSALYEPLHWRQPKRVFVNSMSDLFHENVPDTMLSQIFGVMDQVRVTGIGTVFMILTKRPLRMYEWISRWFENDDHPHKVFENVWLGVSVEDQQRADERIPLLLQTPAAVRFISSEPLLGEIKLQGWDGVLQRNYLDREFIGDRSKRGPIDWVICGGESGPKARPMHIDWARSLRDQCQAAGVPFLFKQWGEWQPQYVDDPRGPLYERVGKKKAGRLLDGQLWDEYPRQS